jgi:hypothetical protein
LADPKLFKEKIKQEISQEYQLEFVGDDFDAIVDKLSDTKADKIHQWVERVVQKDIQPIFIGDTKRYKGHPLHELMTFRYPFEIENVNYRILLIKVKNSVYIEFHLGDHKYYDKVRKDLKLMK